MRLTGQALPCRLTILASRKNHARSTASPYNQRHGCGTLLAQPEMLKLLWRPVCGTRISWLGVRGDIHDEQLPSPEKKKGLATQLICTFRNHDASLTLTAAGFAECGGNLGCSALAKVAATVL